MGRWRAPRPPSAPYITPQGYAALERELAQLWLRRRDVVQALADAAAEGDRSENAEYIYRKKELGGIDRRIRYLQKRLPDLEVVAPRDAADKIYFGAWVTLADENSEVTYRIVGADEIDPSRGWISVDSPMARAMLGKPLDAEVDFVVDGSAMHYDIVDVRYTAPSPDG